MRHELPELPYEMNALEPALSRQTLQLHYGKHHANYVAELNRLIDGTEFAQQTLDDIVKRASGPIFNNAAQHWNHSFYWKCMNPDGGQRPAGTLARAIDTTFGSFDGFCGKFSEAARTLFGSGWCWLVRNEDGSLAISATSNAGSPLTEGSMPLLTCDVWEHAYYIDYHEARAKYLEAFWTLVYWPFVEQNFDAAPLSRAAPMAARR